MPGPADEGSRPPLPGDEPASWVVHLEELRGRLIVCLVTVLVFSGAAYFYTGEILHFLAGPAGGFVFLAPTEAFLVRLKIAAMAGVFFSAPMILFQAWRFVARGLTSLEKRVLRWVLPSSYLLFASGAALAAGVVVPAAIRFLLAYGSTDMRPLLSANAYVGFVAFLTLSFGGLFQLPLVLVFLEKVGVVTRDQLRRRRRIVYLGSFVLAALLTPGPDVFSQVLLAGPTILLFEVSLTLMKRRRGSS